jgi:hypothetical protein
MPRPPIFEWEGKEYAPSEKSADWFWALGIVAIALIVACVLFSQYLLAVLVLVGSVTISLQAAKHPRIHRFAILESGIMIDATFYAYSDMLHFSVLEYADESMPPSLSIKTRHVLYSHLLIPIIGYDPVDVYDYIAAHLPEGNHHESAIDRVIDLLQI